MTFKHTILINIECNFEKWSFNGLIFFFSFFILPLFGLSVRIFYPFCVHVNITNRYLFHLNRYKILNGVTFHAKNTPSNIDPQLLSGVLYMSNRKKRMAFMTKCAAQKWSMEN